MNCTRHRKLKHRSSSKIKSEVGFEEINYSMVLLEPLVPLELISRVRSLPLAQVSLIFLKFISAEALLLLFHFLSTESLGSLFQLLR